MMHISFNLKFDQETEQAIRGVMGTMAETVRRTSLLPQHTVHYAPHITLVAYQVEPSSLEDVRHYVH